MRIAAQRRHDDDDEDDGWRGGAAGVGGGGGGGGSGSSEDDEPALEDMIDVPEGKLGAKKRKKLEMKAEKRAMREVLGTVFSTASFIACFFLDSQYNQNPSVIQNHTRIKIFVQRCHEMGARKNRPCSYP
jgi:hypothetical protein